MKKTIIIFTILLVNQLLFSQVYIRISSLAQNTPEDAEIFLAGNINGWNPGDSNFILEEKENGMLGIDLAEGNGTVEYKFTRGSWESVESNGNGGFRPNRTFVYGNVDTLYLEILGWEDLDGGSGTNSTANEQVEIWDESMYIPQLDRNRRIWIYLPKDYHENSRRYPVLYMHDGQNVFDSYTSFAGEWEVDETLSKMEAEGYPGIIVVAVDNGGSHRIDEYSPFVNTQYGGGEGDKYLDFLIEILKVQIDSSFRTRKEAKYTAIMGSSMGGLISHYAHFRNPDVFGRAGIFSPAYWFSQEYFDHTEGVGKTDSSRLYLLAGALENSIATSTEAMFELLVQMGYSDQEVMKKIPADGNHSEWFWAREFQEAMEWLFPAEEISSIEKLQNNEVIIYPNPAKNSLYIKGKGIIEVEILSLDGKLLEKTIINQEGIIPIQFSGEGRQLIVKLKSKGKQIVKKIITM